MANTYELIASQTVGVLGATSITFSSIANTWTDLKLVSSTRSTVTSNNFYLGQFNGDSGTSNYRTIILQGDGSSASSISRTSDAGIWAGQSDQSTTTANTFSNNEMYIPNYTSSNYKSISVDSVLENNATTTYSDLNAGLWLSTAAITQKSLVPSVGNFAQYSSFYLYGIKNS